MYTYICIYANSKTGTKLKVPNYMSRMSTNEFTENAISDNPFSSKSTVSTMLYSTSTFQVIFSSHICLKCLFYRSHFIVGLGVGSVVVFMGVYDYLVSPAILRHSPCTCII